MLDVGIITFKQKLRVHNYRPDDVAYFIPELDKLLLNRLPKVANLRLIETITDILTHENIHRILLSLNKEESAKTLDNYFSEVGSIATLVKYGWFRKEVK